jgi:hypothetical protein
MTSIKGTLVLMGCTPVYDTRSMQEVSYYCRTCSDKADFGLCDSLHAWPYMTNCTGAAEEIDLLQRMPDYKDYMNEAPRFLPHLWR